jgi:hypothetical protein
MVSDGIKAVQTQARYSPRISSTRTPSTFAKKSILSAVNQVAGRVNHHRAGRRPLGRHAAPAGRFSAATYRAYLLRRHRRRRFPDGSLAEQK